MSSRKLGLLIAIALGWSQGAFCAEQVRIDFGRREDLLKEPFESVDTQYDFLEKPVDAGWQLTIEDLTRTILENNINIKISHLDLDSTARSVVKEDAKFDPTYTLKDGRSRTRTPTLAGNTTLAESVSADASVTQKIFTGGTYTVGMDHDRSNRELHTYASDVVLSFSQPVLKGMGPGVTYADLRISRVNEKISVGDLKDQIIDSITDAQLAYRDILEASELLKARRLAFEQALDLVRQSKKELAVGNRTFTDVLQSEATAASREGDVLQAEDTLLDNEDVLKKLLSVRDLSLWDRRILVKDIIDPIFKPISIPLKEAIQLAFLKRPDYRNALERLKSNEISLRVAENTLLPKLTFDFNYDLNAVGNTGYSLGHMFAGNNPDWGVSLALTLPWGYRTELADYNQKLNTVTRQQLTIRDLELQIIKEVRSAVRQVQTDIQRVNSAELAYTLQTKKLEAEQKKYEVGLSSSFEVLEYQEDLRDASVTRIGTITDYHQSVIRLWQTLGTTLEQNGILFEEKEAGA